MQTRIVRHDPVDSGHQFRIYFIGDLHIGNKACHKGIIRRMVDQVVQDDNCTVVLMGDIIDAIVSKDKRHRSKMLDPDLGKYSHATIDAQVDMALELLSPLKGRILGALIGNHEETILDIAETDPMLRLYDNLELAVPYRQAYCAYYRILFPKKGKAGNSAFWRLNLVAHHGAGGGLYIGAKANRIERRAGIFSSAHILAAGHVHSRMIDPNHIGLDLDHNATIDEPDLREHPCVCFLTGSALKGYAVNTDTSAYTERKDYPPAALGGVYADIKLTSHTEGELRTSVNGGLFPF